MFRSGLVALMTSILVTPMAALAQDFQIHEPFNIPVYPIDATTFEVVENGGAGGTQMWCAAGKFTREVLGQRGGAIYILEPRGASQAVEGRKSVVFTTNAVDGAFGTLTQGVGRAGQTFSMAHAYALCRDTRFLRIRVGAN